MNDMPHLRQIDAETVAALCGRALAVSPSHTIRQEALGFRDSRTPWDATRLANALAKSFKPTVELLALVADLDRAAEECAGVAPTNRLPRDPDYDGVSG